MITNVWVKVWDWNSEWYVWLFQKEFVFDRTLLKHPNLQWEDIINSMWTLKAAVMKWWQWNKMWIVLKKFEELKENLERDLRVNNLDPILYIIGLYYWSEPMSLDTIFNRLNSKWLNYKDRSWLEKVLKRFAWKLKDHEERQNTKKVLIMHPEKAIESAKIKSEECRIKFLHWVVQNLIDAEDPYFDIKYLNSLPSAIKKCNYLLKTFYSCDLTSFNGTWLWSRTIVRYLQPILDDLTTKLKLERVVITMSWVGEYIKKWY